MEELLLLGSAVLRHWIGKGDPLLGAVRNPAGYWCGDLLQQPADWIHDHLAGSAGPLTSIPPTLLIPGLLWGYPAIPCSAVNPSIYSGEKKPFLR